MTKNLFKVALIASVAVALSACGKTNPMDDYPDLKNSKPFDETKAPETAPPAPQPAPQPVVPQVKKEEPKSYIDSAQFQIHIADNLNFVEGKEATYIVKPRSLVAKANFKLVALEKPEGVTFAPVNAAEPMGDYKLTWKPRIGTLVNQEARKLLSFSIGAEVTGGDATAVARLKRIAVPRDAKGWLFKTDELPKIAQNDLKSRGITEIQAGDKIAFTITVEDKGAFSGNTPRLFVDDDRVNNNELNFVSGRRYVSIVGQPQDKGNGTFVFSAEFDSRGLEIPAGKTSVIARFTVLARSPSGLITPDESISLKVVKKQEAQ